MYILFAIPTPDQFFDCNGVRIRYVSIGEREPIIPIHGWSASAEMWASTIQDLSHDRVIVLFTSGHLTPAVDTLETVRLKTGVLSPFTIKGCALH